MVTAYYTMQVRVCNACVVLCLERWWSQPLLCRTAERHSADVWYTEPGGAGDDLDIEPGHGVKVTSRLCTVYASRVRQLSQVRLIDFAAETACIRSLDVSNCKLIMDQFSWLSD